MTDHDKKRDAAPDDLALEALFAEAREAAPIPSGDLLARIMADAETERAARFGEKQPPQPAPSRHPVIAAMVAALGGWRSVAGLATAGVAGLAIGLGAPGAVATLATSGDLAASSTVADLGSYELDDLVPSFYTLAAEG
nr:hypothetical protein [uncultured Celeribacter sp.]